MKKEMTISRETMADFFTPSGNPVKSSAPPVREITPGEDSTLIHVLLLHEDLPSGLRGKRLLDRLDGKSEVKPRFVVNLWRFDLIRDSQLHEQAVKDAKYADIIVLALRGDDELPDSVRQWFRRWVMSRTGDPCALVVSFDNSVQGSAGSRLTLEGLRAVAATSGVDVFPHYSDSTIPARNWADQQVSTPERQGTISLVSPEPSVNNAGN